MTEFFNIYGLFPTGLYLIAWAIAVIFAVKMKRQGGGTAERFLVIGVSLMLASSFFHTLTDVLNPWILNWVHQYIRGSATTLGIVFSIIGAFYGLIALVGIIFLVRAFWVKFKTKV